MFRSITALLALCALAACATAPEPVPVGYVDMKGARYPIFTTPTGWAVQTEGRQVSCPTATQTDCYWSLRSFFQANGKTDLID